MDGHVGKVHGQTPGQHHAAFDRFDQLWRIAMAGVVGTAGIGNADHGPIQCAVGVARALDEGFAQKQGELFVAIRGQAFAQAGLANV